MHGEVSYVTVPFFHFSTGVFCKGVCGRGTSGMACPPCRLSLRLPRCALAPGGVAGSSAGWRHASRLARKDHCRGLARGFLSGHAIIQASHACLSAVGPGMCLTQISWAASRGAELSLGARGRAFIHVSQFWWPSVVGARSITQACHPLKLSAIQLADSPWIACGYQIIAGASRLMLRRKRTHGRAGPAANTPGPNCIHSA